ncbi:dTDP-4-dehydrorhamnose 3,5-epimerase [Cellvibrio zantedeschiae]|uniref:dTDP-4-dehydrorhamnose 3,5-epimerase n=1 Tax=Cellvibrio zantedeschiae TaxID=1237077 RepID=A0ABQ3ASQ4_9GAMM|nr:dTDP-4-dehydrorhamnose 3,5-epimerase family protein [Cellvibrio zantedeschiae]GGY62937.1 dTDP-4-dehydrorhamnose 3,5-epimerase [Cellvibrio zantedeschiae]
MIEIIKTEIENCLIINFTKHNDNRGYFTKIFESNFFAKHNLATNFQEIYYTSSNKGVVRGMHFQLPPADHEKLVHCASGHVLDVVVDLRKSSKSYGKCQAFQLSEKVPQAIYIPRGMAHGFLSQEDNSTLIYCVTSSHNASLDTGILWSSLAYKWPIENPTVSDRDMSFAPLAEFDSPF